MPERGTAPAASFLPAPVAASGSVGTLLGLALRRPGGRRAISLLTIVLLVSGVAMMSFPAFTDVFQRYRQHLAHLGSSPQYLDQWKLHHIKIGQGLTKLVINNNRMHVSVVVVEGTTPAALNAGAGHYESTPYPCDRGNVGIAGHRTTYGRPFNKLDEMHKGDTVDLITPFARCTYQVIAPFGGHKNPWVVRPDAWNVISQDGALGTGYWLTLTSCNPPGSDSQRIVLRLRLIRTVPVHHAKAAS